jgi:Protein of unknown function (DUF3089)
VTVPVGKTVGGDFANIPACQTATQTGCVVAYSSFDATPPAGAGPSEAAAYLGRL